MKKRFLLPLITICTIISITIGIASFSYAWLNQVPSYSFTLSTGDYPLLVNANIYLAKYNSRAKEETYNYYDGTNTETTSTNGTLGYEYGDKNGNILKLDKTSVNNFNYKSYTLDNETGQMIPNVNGDQNSSSIDKTQKGKVTFNFPELSCDIFDVDNQGLSMIGNSLNNYSLNAKYFYVGFVEFLFLKQFFNAYLICLPSYSVSIDGQKVNDLIQFTFIDSDQNDEHFNFDNSKSTYLTVSDSGSVTTNGLLNQTENDVFYQYTTINDRTFRMPTSSMQNIYVTNDGGVTFSGREIAAISRIDDITKDNCYSYASVYGIYLNPVKLFELSKERNIGNSTINLSLTFDFYLSDNNISNEDIGFSNGE